MPPNPNNTNNNINSTIVISNSTDHSIRSSSNTTRNISIFLTTSNFNWSHSITIRTILIRSTTISSSTTTLSTTPTTIKLRGTVIPRPWNPVTSGDCVPVYSSNLRFFRM